MITVVIPTHPGREALLERAVNSVLAQTAPSAIHIELDSDRLGAAATRNRALERVETEWVAFLDSDDYLKPDHLKFCARHSGLTGADVVYPGYDVEGGEDPINCFGMTFNPHALKERNYIPITTLCRTDLVRKVGGFRENPDENGDPCEDWGLWLALLEVGAKFSHLPQRTWVWNLTGGTRGRADAARG